MTVLSGQTENAGHFLQLTAMATGHKVMALLLFLPFENRTERDATLERHCKRIGTEVQTNLIRRRAAEKDSGSLVGPPHVCWDTGKTPTTRQMDAPLRGELCINRVASRDGAVV